METLLQDIRYSLRIVARSPGFLAAAVISLTLGIGPNTMIFSLVNAVLLKPLAVDEPDRLVRVFSSDDEGSFHPHSYPDYIDYRDRQQVFTGLAACQRMMMSINTDGRAELAAGAVVSANFFAVLGVQPTLGRTFTPEEDRSIGQHAVAVISYSLWQRRFNADRALVGKKLRLNGCTFDVIGIAPKGFIGVDSIFATDVWVPITMYPKLAPREAQALDPISGRDDSWLNDVIGRLRPGANLAQARSNLNDISSQLERAYPEVRKSREKGVTVAPFSSVRPEFRSSLLSFATLLLVVTGLVLLIACANVANLSLTRAMARQKEIAMRLALGANRWRLVRQMLTESVLLALAGGVAGILMAYWTRDLLLTFKPSVSIPMTIDLSMDQRVLGFNLTISVLTGIIFGLAPALRTSRTDLVSALKADTLSLGLGDRGSRLHSLLVIAQMALSLVLLISAALLLRSIQNAYKTDPGFEKKNLVLLSTELDLRGYADGEGTRFYQRLIDRVRSLPGLRSVSLTSIFPLSFASAETEINVEGSRTRREGGQTTPDKGGMSQQVNALSPEESPGGRTVVSTSSVAPGYFETMGIPLVQGREFSHHDTEGGPGVIIINQSMASRFWPRENPIGKRVNIDPLNPQGRYYEVIGVAQDSKFGTLRESAQPFMYMCILQQYSSSITLVARVNSDPGKMLAVISREVQSLDADLPVFDVKTVTEHLDITLFPLRMATILIGMLGALAMLLSVVGLYAVVAYSVTLRTRELGIRMALGASSIHVLKSVIARGTLLAVIGIAIGLVLALMIAQAMSNLGLLYGISAIDPTTFLTVSLLLISVAMLASYIPARRATKIDPVNALRQE